MIAYRTASQSVLKKEHESKLLQTRRERKSEFIHLDGLKKTLLMKLGTPKPPKTGINAA
ncbi:MAG TPA: hypothetical protein VMH85_20230 [Terriglobales bacterium]|nr:hypothetical protein [Terriglobales bacterium]